MEILAISLTILAICSIITTILIYDLKKKIVSPCTDCKTVNENYDEICSLNNQLDNALKEIKRLQDGFRIVREKANGPKIILTDERGEEL